MSVGRLPMMRESIRDGDTVLVALAAANHDPDANCSYTFGHGSHECQGTKIAYTLAEAGAEAIVQAENTLLRFTLAGYRPSPNVRIPQFANR